MVVLAFENRAEHPYNPYLHGIKRKTIIKNCSLESFSKSLFVLKFNHPRNRKARDCKDIQRPLNEKKRRRKKNDEKWENPRLHLLITIMKIQ